MSYPAGSGFFLHRQHSAGPGGSLQGTQEVRFVDGTVHVLEKYTGPVAGAAAPWRITKRLDAYDNLTLYRYGSDGRLARIEYPNGVDEVYDYAPSWIGSTKWPSTGSGIRYSGIEVRFVDRPTGTALPDRTIRYVFLKRSSVNHGNVTALDSQGQPIPGLEPATAPFNGDLLFRVYLPQGRMLNDLANLHDNVLYDLSTDQARHRILEYSYVAGTSLLASVGVRFSDSITGVDSSLATFLVYEYEQVGGRARVKREAYPIEGIHYDWTYVCDTGVADQHGQNPATLTQRLSSLGARKTWTFDAQGRILVEAFEPRSGPAVEDRTLDPAYDATRHASGQLTIYQTTYEYGVNCSCGGKPTAVIRPGGGRTEYDYDPITGLVTEVREPDPKSGTGFAVTSYDWEPAVPGDLYGRYRLKSMTDADGNVWTYGYTSTARMDPGHGTKDSQVTTTSPIITGSVASSASLQVVETHNVSHPILSAPAGTQKELVGQLTRVKDEDGLETDYEYDNRGWLDRSLINTGGGVNEVVNEFDHDAWGRLQQVRLRVGSPQALTTTYVWDGQGNLSKAAMTVGGVLHEQEFYYDRWGNLSVARKTNKTSSGAAPNDFHPTAPRTETARGWVREEWHYQRGFLAVHFEDRRPLDRNDSGSVADAVDARMVKTDLSWTADGWLHQIVNPSGAVRQFSYDGFGVPFREVVLDPAGGEIIVSKQFVDAALLPIAVVDGNGAELEITRSLTTGLVSVVREPSTASVPIGYPWSVSRAESSIAYDSLGRVASVTASEVGGAVLLKQVATFDQIGRSWKTEVFEGAGATPSQVYQRQWTGSRLTREDYPGGRYVTRAYDALGRLQLVSDSLSAGPNRVRRQYFDKSPFVSRIVRELWDEAATTPDHVDRPVEYVLDELGRVKVMKVARSDGGAGTLDHAFAYYTTGQTESYTDPTGKVERFLPDGLGRLRERFLPGTQPIWNGTKWLDWIGPSNESEKHLTDGLGHTTKEIFDFAGRPWILMEPGSSVLPTPSSPHQAHARLFTYDAASRLTDVYGADDVHLVFDHDAVGRLLQRSRVFTQLNSIVSNLWGRDSLRRNALGQLIEISSRTGFGPGGIGDEYIREQFSRDALGRTLYENYEYGASIANQARVTSAFVGGDPFRSELHVSNTVGAGTNDLYMRYVPDAIGRVASIDWKASSGTSWIDLVDYAHEGSAIRSRHITQALGIAQGATPFEFTTTYDYDVYGRMSHIEHSFDPQNAYYDFHYDAASNLVKEGYVKQGGGVGDRFGYDEHHRLLDAWLGSNQQHFDAADPNGGVGTFVKNLTYNLDAANNRDTVVENGVTTDYAIESGSNRYAQIGGVTLAHDARGNTHFNGECFFVFDALDRLSEVYKLVPQDVSSGLTSAQSLQGSETTFSVNDLSALDAARNQILQRLAPQAAALLHLPDDPGVRANSKEGLNPTVATATTTEASGQQTQDEVVLELVAFYLYDPMNRRVTRWVRDDATYYYAYDGWQEVQKYGIGAQTTLVQSARGEQFDELVAYRVKSGSGAWVNRYIAEGGAHCPMRVLDESGAVAEVQEYDPYGRATYFAGGQAYSGSQVGLDYGWRMMPVDPETGLAYSRNRYYDPLTGRFISQDPLGVGGDAVAWHNAYNYGSASPLQQSDPLGLQIITQPITFQGDIVFSKPDGGTFLAPYMEKGGQGYVSVAPEGSGAGGWYKFDGDTTPGHVHSYDGAQAAYQQGAVDPWAFEEAMLKAETAASVIPPVGEAMDVAMLLDSDASPRDRVLAGVSLLANIFTGGAAPNYAGLSRGQRLVRSLDCADSIVTTAARGGARVTGDALKAARSEFNKVRPQFWRNEAATNAGRYGADDLARMKQGKPPIGSDGFPMELHHRTPLSDGGSNAFDNLVPMNRTEHRLGPNFGQNHPNR